MSEDFQFALDIPTAIPLGSHAYIVRGWCFAKSPNQEFQIDVIVDGRRVPAFLGFSRPDVAKHFGNPAAVSSGFVARFRHPVSTTVALVGCSNGVEFLIANNIPVALDVDLAPTPAKELAYSPSISVLLSAAHASHFFLTRSIESVLEQTYSNWQLCIDSDGSCAEILQAFAQQEKRISDSFRSANGDFVVLLDQQDELHPDALQELAVAANQWPSVKVFYSDEEKLDEYGVPGQPLFKPEFDRNSFLSFNYLSHMVGLKRGLFEETGGFHPGYDGAKDWDLLLRATRLLSDAEIKHIPKRLYYRREGQATEVKAQTAVLRDYLRRSEGDAAITEGLFPGSVRIHYPALAEVELAVFLRAEDGPFQESVIRLNAGRRTLHIYKDCDQHSPVPADVLVFINGSLESLNHLFFEELVSQAKRPDVGVVTGISLTSNSRLLATGFVQSNVVRTLKDCPTQFFAFQKKHTKSSAPILFTPYAVATFTESQPPIHKPGFWQKANPLSAITKAFSW